MAYRESDFMTAEVFKTVSGVDIRINKDGAFYASIKDWGWKASRNLREVEKWIVESLPKGEVDVVHLPYRTLSTPKAQIPDRHTIIGTGIEPDCRPSRYTRCDPKFQVKRRRNEYGSYYMDRKAAMFRPNPEADEMLRDLNQEMSDATVEWQKRLDTIWAMYEKVSAEAVDKDLEAQAAKRNV